MTGDCVRRTPQRDVLDRARDLQGLLSSPSIVEKMRFETPPRKVLRTGVQIAPPQSTDFARKLLRNDPAISDDVEAPSLSPNGMMELDEALIIK